MTNQSATDLNKKLLNILKYVFGFGLGIFLFWLAFRDRSVDSLINDLRSANPWWLLIAIAINMLSHYLRGLRWQMQPNATGYYPSSFHTFASVMIGYLVNLAIPRGGEVARCSILYRTDKIPVSTGFGTVVVERVFDLIVLIILIGLLFLMESEKLLAYWAQLSEGKESSGGGLPIWLYILGGIFVAGCILVFILRKKILASPLGQKAKNFLLELMQAALSIRHLKRPWLFILYTLLIWLAYWLMTYIAFFAIEDIANAQGINLMYFGFVVLITGGIGMALPIPGGLGPYHNAVMYTFILFAVFPSPEMCKQVGQTCALAIHTSQMLIAIPIVGALCYLYMVTVKPKDSSQSSVGSPQLTVDSEE